MAREFEVKTAIVAAAQEMESLGLSPGRSGNVSVRWKGGMLITASGLPPRSMNADKDVVYVDASGSPRGARTPSSEWRLHQAIYEARPSIGSVVHCHSTFATALACARLPIPAFHYMVAKAGGSDIPLAPYATYGTMELALAAAAALRSRNACLLANHGQVAVGEKLDDALELAKEIEVLAAQYVAARCAGEPVLLPEAEMLRVVEMFKGYGKQTGKTKPRGARDKARPKSKAVLSG